MNDYRTQWLLLAAIALLAVLLFYPSLDSSFLLDDYINLNRLEEINERGYAYYIFSGLSGPSGRPLSLATFALQYSAWPASPSAFKSVNLLLHLINGILIFFISRFLLKKINIGNRQAYTISLIAMGLWLLHPLQLSTVLYVVQRMTQLSTLFILSGIAGYLYFRDRFRQSGDNKALLYAGLVIAAATGLGILAKENGILLPLYILVIEAVFFSDNKNNKPYQLWLAGFLITPLVILIAYFGYNFENILGGYEKRAFGMQERLLTQAVILFEYLKVIFIPHPDAFSVYHDDYRAVRGLFNPAYVFAAVVAIVALLTAAIKYRKRFPIPSFAVLWFFAGHSLESSFLSLELYFEHRNYLASLGIFLLVGWLMVTGFHKATSRFLAGGLAGVYLIVILVVSVMELRLWANPVLQAAEWAETHPRSLRAQTNLADMYLIHGQYDKADETYNRVSRTHPKVLFPYLKKLLIKGCVRKETIEGAFWSDLYKTASVAKYDNYASLRALDDLVININMDHCDKINPINLSRVMLILAKNPKYEHLRWAFHEMTAILSIYVSDADSALNNINRSIELRPYPKSMSLKVKILLAMGDNESAKVALDEFKEDLEGKPRQKLAYMSIMDELEESLGDD